MAQIKLNATYGLTGTLPAVSGANLTTLNATNISSGTLNSARYTAGGVIKQQTRTEETDTDYEGTTSTSFVSVSGYSVVITPQASDNIIKVMFFMGRAYASHTNYLHFAIQRQISGGSNTSFHAGDSIASLHSSSDTSHSPITLMLMDTDYGTTSEITYQLFMKTSASTSYANHQDSYFNAYAEEMEL